MSALATQSFVLAKRSFVLATQSFVFATRSFVLATPLFVLATPPFVLARVMFSPTWPNVCPCQGRFSPAPARPNVCHSQALMISYSGGERRPAGANVKGDNEGRFAVTLSLIFRPHSINTRAADYLY